MHDRRIRLTAVLALLVLATILPLCGFAVHLIVRSWHETRAAAEGQNVDTARAVSVAIDTEVESVAAALEALAATNAVERRDPAAFREILERLLARNPSWLSALLVDARGEVLVSSADTPVAFGLADAPWVRQVTLEERMAVSDLREDPSTGEFYVTIAVPVRAGENETTVTHALAARIRASRLSELLNRQRLTEDGVVTLLDGGKRIMARTRNEEQLRGGLPTEGFLAATARMSEGSWRDTLLEGTPTYAALSRSRLTGWTVGIGLPAEAIDRPMYKSLWALLGVGLFVLALGVACGVMLGRSIVQGFRSALAGAAALARSEPVPPTRSRIVEIDELALGLGEAAAILESRLGERDRALDAERRARTASERDEARLAVTLRSIGEGVVTTDVQRRVSLLNRAAEKLTGWSDEGARDRLIEEVCTFQGGATGAALEEPVARALAQRDVVMVAGDAVLVTRDGRRVPVEASAAPIRAADGSPVGSVLVLRDVTERRDAERQRAILLEQERTAREEAEALSRSKDEFVATVSHELRNPLNAIFGWVRLLQTGQIDEGSREHALQVIERNTRAQAQLVEDLLDMSRVITGKLRLEMRELDLGAVLEEAVEGVHPTAEAKALEVDVQIDPEAPRVLGDAERLRQVAWNLLSNAIKFTPKSGRIEASVGGAGSEVRLCVRDSGVGIERSLLPHVFERFRQGETDPSWGKAGLGIGLALVRHMVEAHAGRVEAASDGPGSGATFTVWLPAIGPRAVLASTERRGPPVAREAHGGLGGVRVLVVDDDADARDLICTTLRQHGARVTPAASVRDALEVLQTTTPEIVISDIAMPYANGYDLLTQLRALPRTADVPVVALTASNRAEDRARALAAGFELHVGKPVDPGALVQAVASVRRATREE